MYTDYKVVEKVELRNGKGFYADVVAPKLHKGTHKKILSRIALEIAKHEGLHSLSLYCNHEAIKANFSKKYKEEHPGLLENNYLGAVEGKRFIKSPYVGG